MANTFPISQWVVFTASPTASSITSSSFLRAHQGKICKLASGGDTSVKLFSFLKLESLHLLHLQADGKFVTWSGFMPSLASPLSCQQQHFQSCSLLAVRYSLLSDNIEAWYSRWVHLLACRAPGSRFNFLQYPKPPHHHSPCSLTGSAEPCSCCSALMPLLHFYIKCSWCIILLAINLMLALALQPYETVNPALQQIR